MHSEESEIRVEVIQNMEMMLGCVAIGHKILFPDITLESQCLKFEEEWQEYLNTQNDDEAINEICDCIIVCAGIYRFSENLAKVTCLELLNMLAQDYGTPHNIIMKRVLKKWKINTNRVWKKLEDGRYHHEE